MIRKELTDYIQTQLRQGQSYETLRAKLNAGGWQLSDIDAAFQALSEGLPGILPEQNERAPKNFSIPLWIGILSGILFVLLCSFLWYIILFKHQSSPTKQAAIQASVFYSQPTSSAKVSPTSTPQLIFYSNPQYNYGFKVLPSWKIAKQKGLTVLAAPNNPHVQQCEADLKSILLYCDMDVFITPYASISTAPGVIIVGGASQKPHSQQVKDLATQMAQTGSISSTTINNLPGYEISITTMGGSSYNVVLQGAKNMIILQFIHIKSQSELSTGELTVLNSIVEQ